MKTKVLAVLTLLTLVVTFAVPTFAQEPSKTKTITITVSEDAINSSYHVTNPRNRKITDAKVDLQTGQASVSFTFTERGKDPLKMVAVLLPVIKTNNVTWTLSTLTVNGTAATQDQINLINTTVGNSLRYEVRSLLKAKAHSKCPATAVTVSDTQISVTYTCSK